MRACPVETHADFDNGDVDNDDVTFVNVWCVLRIPRLVVYIHMEAVISNTAILLCICLCLLIRQMVIDQCRNLLI